MSRLPALLAVVGALGFFFGSGSIAQTRGGHFGHGGGDHGGGGGGGRGGYSMERGGPMGGHAPGGYGYPGYGGYGHGYGYAPQPGPSPGYGGYVYGPPPRSPNSLGAGWRPHAEVQARSMVRQGHMAPLGPVIERLERRDHGRPLDAGIEYRDGRTVYRVRWITTRGRRIDYLVDAATGAVLGGR